jgi:hypothetical protein
MQRRMSHHPSFRPRVRRFIPSLEAFGKHTGPTSLLIGSVVIPGLFTLDQNGEPQRGSSGLWASQAGDAGMALS